MLMVEGKNGSGSSSLRGPGFYVKRGRDFGLRDAQQQKGRPNGKVILGGRLAKGREDKTPRGGVGGWVGGGGVGGGEGGGVGFFWGGGETGGGREGDGSGSRLYLKNRLRV